MSLPVPSSAQLAEPHPPPHKQMGSSVCRALGSLLDAPTQVSHPGGAFSGCHPKMEHSRVSLSVHFFKDFSLEISGDAESSSQLGTYPSACRCCLAPGVRPPRRQSSITPPRCGDTSTIQLLPTGVVCQLSWLQQSPLLISYPYRF